MKMVDTKKETVRGRSVSGIRVNRTGRRTYTLKYKLDVVRQSSQPGVSVAAIALADGINANLLRRWIVRHQRAPTASVAEPPTILLPVTMAAATSVLGSRADDLVDASAK